MNTLGIEKPLSLDIGLCSGLAGLLATWAERIADWHHHSRQRDLEAYLGASQNIADLEQRLQNSQYSGAQTFI